MSNAMKLDKSLQDALIKAVEHHADIAAIEGLLS